MNTEIIYAIIGGLLIGSAVSLFMLCEGRVMGISGILNGLLKPVKGDWGWRFAFVIGIVLGGLALSKTYPEFFMPDTLIASTDSPLFLAGVLVGFGALMANGCTSGHGICGVSRISKRSIIATLLFISAGALTVYIRRILS